MYIFDSFFIDVLEIEILSSNSLALLSLSVFLLWSLILVSLISDIDSCFRLASSLNNPKHIIKVIDTAMVNIRDFFVLDLKIEITGIINQNNKVIFAQPSKLPVMIAITNATKVNIIDT